MHTRARFYFATAVIVFLIIAVMPVLFIFGVPAFSQNISFSELIGTFSNQRELQLMGRSGVIASGAALLAFVIGVPFAFLCSKTNLWGRRFFKILYFIPVLIPPYLHAIVWHRFNPLFRPLFDVHSPSGIILVLGLAYFPFIALMTMSALESVERSLEEASLLCRGPAGTASNVLLPLVWPHVFSGAVFVFIFSLVDFSAADIFRVNVYPVEIFVEFSALYHEKTAMMLSLPLVFLTVILITVQRWFIRGKAYVQMMGKREDVIQYDLGRFQIPAFLFCMIILVISAALPLLSLFISAGPLSTYVRVLQTSIEPLRYSLLWAVLGSFAAVLTAFFLSYGFERSKARISAVLSYVVLIPLAVPAITIGIGLIKVWNQPWTQPIYTSGAILVIAYMARFIPFAVLALSSGIKQINPSIEEAAFLNSGSWIYMARKILIPMLKPSLLAAFFIVFVLSLTDLATILLVIPAGFETVPIKIYNLMHYSADDLVSALSIVLLVIIFAMSAMIWIVFERMRKKLEDVR